MQPTTETLASVAVIIVNWNGGDLLMRSLEALRLQTLKPKKIFVVDNNSCDGSALQVKNRFPEVHLFTLKENIGFAAANNLAAKHAIDCDWIALLNPDAFATPTWIEALVEAARQNPDFSLFGSRMLMADSPNFLDGVGDSYHISGLVWREGHHQPAENNHMEECEIFSPCAAAALYKSTVFTELSGFDEDFFCYAEDVDLGFRARLLGHQCLYVPKAIVLHKGSALTGKKSAFSIYHGHRNITWTFIKNVPLPLFLLLLPIHIAVCIATLIWFPLQGNGKAIFMAKLDALKGARKMWAKRTKIQSTKVANTKSLINLMRVSFSR